MAAAEASFRTWIDSMSLTLKSRMLSVGNPSITYNGELFVKLLIPRIVANPVSPGRPFMLISMPGIVPFILSRMDVVGISPMLFLSMTEIAPVRSFLFMVP